MAGTWSMLGLTQHHWCESGAILKVLKGCKVEFSVAGLWGQETQHQGK